MIVSFLLIHGVIECSSNNRTQQKKSVTSIYNRMTQEGYNLMFHGDRVFAEEILKKSERYDQFKEHKDFDQLIQAVITRQLEKERKLVLRFMDEQD